VGSRQGAVSIKLNVVCYLIQEGITEEDALDKNKIFKRTPIEIKGAVALGLKIIKSNKK